jgi:L-alanine-DL-glutamate epimerase-like enolase superfamily enzyme
MTAMRHVSRTAAATYELLAELPLEIDSYSATALQQPVAPEFTRRTTVIELLGAGETGIGEDVTPTEREQLLFARAGTGLDLTGRWTLDSFSAHLETLNLFPAPAPAWLPRTFRRWGFESAALDLALRQAGRSLAGVLNLEPRPVAFVNSLRLSSPPSIEPVRRRLELFPDLRFKLDPNPEWDEQLIEALAATGAVAILDLKGQYPSQAPPATPPDARVYAQVAEAFPDAVLEDPAVTPATEQILDRHRDRIVWDAPIRTADDVERLPFRPGTINVKPARIGTLQRLLELYDHCSHAGIATYGGGMFELGPGRGQLQYLASLFHNTASNDVAPCSYNERELSSDSCPSPLDFSASSTGFRSGTHARQGPEL